MKYNKIILAAAIAFFLASMALTFAYKAKLDEANRYINHLERRIK